MMRMREVGKIKNENDYYKYEGVFHTFTYILLLFNKC